MNEVIIKLRALSSFCSAACALENKHNSRWLRLGISIFKGKENGFYNQIYTLSHCINKMLTDYV